MDHCWDMRKHGRDTACRVGKERLWFAQTPFGGCVTVTRPTCHWIHGSPAGLDSTELAPQAKPAHLSPTRNEVRHRIWRMVKKLVEPIMPGKVFDVNGIPDSGGLLLPAGSARSRPYNPTPDQKLAHHPEDTRHDEQLPSARTQPEPHRLLRSLDPSPYGSGENEETPHRRQLVAGRAVVLADRDWFSPCAVVGEKEPNQADRSVQSVRAQDQPQG